MPVSDKNAWTVTLKFQNSNPVARQCLQSLCIFFLVFLGGCEEVTHILAGYNRLKKINNIYPVGTEATFSCGILFKLLGPRKSTCEASGSWDPKPGRCSRKFHY